MSQSLLGCHIVGSAVTPGGAQWMTTFHPSPGNTIYVRKWSIYPWGAQSNYSSVGIGYLSIQKDSANGPDQIGIAVTFLSGNPNPVAEKDFEPNYMLLGPNDLILVEAGCAAGFHAFQPVYDVLWTTGP